MFLAASGNTFLLIFKAMAFFIHKKEPLLSVLTKQSQRMPFPCKKNIFEVQSDSLMGKNPKMSAEYFLYFLFRGRKVEKSTRMKKEHSVFRNRKDGIRDKERSTSPVLCEVCKNIRKMFKGFLPRIQLKKSVYRKSSQTPSVQVSKENWQIQYKG